MLSLYAHETPFLSDIGAPYPELSSPTKDDAGLVQAALMGDRAAEEQLYLRHVHYVQGLLVRLLGSRAEAEDAIQETFVIALDQLPSLREPAAFRPWLAQIAVSQARRRFRRAKLLRALGLHRSGEDVGLDELSAPYATFEVQADGGRRRARCSRRRTARRGARRARGGGCDRCWERVLETLTNEETLFQKTSLHRVPRSRDGGLEVLARDGNAPAPQLQLREGRRIER
jgi:DNA-directed RNA polymerase specialized sigma24 family protein